MADKIYLSSESNPGEIGGIFDGGGDEHYPTISLQETLNQISLNIDAVDSSYRSISISPESISIDEVVLFDVEKDVNEIISADSNINILANFVRTYNSSSPATDGFSRDVIFNREYQDTSATTDVVTTTSSFIRSIPEILLSVDSLTTTLSYGRSFADSVLSDDLLNVGDGLLYSMSVKKESFITSADNTSLLATFSRAIGDTSSTVDVGSYFIEDYFETPADYMPGQYIGSNGALV